MNHLDEGTVQAYLDDELDRDGRDHFENHLSGCLACRTALREQESLGDRFSAAVASLDSPSPRARDYAVGFPRRASAPGLRSVQALPRAAVLLLAFAAAAAAAVVPGSPLRRWAGMEAESAPVAVRRSAPVAPEAPAATVAAAAVPEAGLSIDPVDGGIRVDLVEAGAEVTIHARLSEGEQATVLGRGLAAAARFSTGPGRIEVNGAAGGEIDIELPRAAARASVRVNGREYLRKQGDELVLALPAARRAGAHLTFQP